MTDVEIVLELVRFAQEASISFIFLYLFIRESRKRNECHESHVYDLRLHAQHPLQQEKPNNNI